MSALFSRAVADARRGGNVYLFTSHTGGHAGYEMSPFIPTLANVALVAARGVRHGFRGFNTVQHHDMHHRHPAKHFSLYFTHWDRLCGTLHPKYDESIFAYFPAETGVAAAGAGPGKVMHGTRAHERRSCAGGEALGDAQNGSSGVSRQALPAAL